MWGGQAQPVDNRNSFLFALSFARNDDGVERLSWIQLVQAVVGQQVEAGLAVNHLMRLGSGHGDAVAR